MRASTAVARRRLGAAHHGLQSLQNHALVPTRSAPRLVHELGDPHSLLRAATLTAAGRRLMIRAGAKVDGPQRNLWRQLVTRPPASQRPDRSPSTSPGRFRRLLRFRRTGRRGTTCRCRGIDRLVSHQPIVARMRQRVGEAESAAHLPDCRYCARQEHVVTQPVADPGNRRPPVTSPLKPDRTAATYASGAHAVASLAWVIPSGLSAMQVAIKSGAPRQSVARGRT